MQVPSLVSSNACACVSKETTEICTQIRHVALDQSLCFSLDEAHSSNMCRGTIRNENS